MATYIGLNENGQVTYENEPNEERTMFNNDTGEGDTSALEQEIESLKTRVTQLSNDLASRTLTSVTKTYTNVQIPESHYSNLDLPNTNDASKYVGVKLVTWSAPTTGTIDLGIELRENNAAVFTSATGVTIPSLTLKFIKTTNYNIS